MTAKALVSAGRNYIKSLNVKPIQIGPFSLDEMGFRAHGRPSFKEYEVVGVFILRTHRATGWWLVDWIRYGDARPDWEDQIDALIDADNLTEASVAQYRFVGSRFPDHETRVEGVPFLHHQIVASEPEPAVRRRLLVKARDEGWTGRELRLEMHALRRRKVLEGQAALEGMYRVIYADPPWVYSDRPPGLKGAAEHYPGLTIEALEKLPVKAHVLPNSVLLMWVTAPLMLQNPGPREVGEAWGFTYKQQFVWDKVDGTFSHYTGGNHEILTIWTRGSCLPDVPTGLPDSVQVFRKTRVHSAKPPEFRQLITKHWTQGPYLELFGREPVPGWSVFGNDARLWGQDARRDHAAGE